MEDERERGSLGFRTFAESESLADDEKTPHSVNRILPVVEIFT